MRWKNIIIDIRFDRVRYATLVEVVLLFSALAVITAAVTPAAVRMHESAKQARVKMELNAIAVGLAEFARDVGYLPGLEPGAEVPLEGLVLTSKGEFPTVRSAARAGMWRQAHRKSLTQYLRSAENSPLERWAGPYLSHNLGADPWGRAYVVNIKSQAQSGGDSPASSKPAVFVISAGANGNIETPFEQTAADTEIGRGDYAVRVQ